MFLTESLFPCSKQRSIKNSAYFGMYTHQFKLQCILFCPFGLAGGTTSQTPKEVENATVMKMVHIGRNGLVI